jgi:acyl-CoA synthetase (AMP-forming)/AMP-acid ligase II
MRTTLADPLHRAERLHGDQIAVIDGDTQLSYRHLADRCRRLARALVSRGVCKGDRIAVLMNNGHRYLESYFAVPGMGAVLVPLNNRHTVAEHLAILEDAGDPADRG